MAADVRVPLIHFSNFADALCTLYAVGLLGVEEANPLLSWCFQYSETGFLVFKFVFVTFAVSYLDAVITRSQRWLMSAILSVLMITLCWHAYGIVFLTATPSPG